MSDRKVIPFRKRPPSPVQLAMFQQMTRHWHPDMRRLICPEYEKPERDPPTR